MSSNSAFLNGWQPDILKQYMNLHGIPFKASERLSEHQKILQRLISYPPTPRGAIAYSEGRIDADLERLDLSYQPLAKPPVWKPRRRIKPWEAIEPQITYLDIETTGLYAEKARVIMVGILRGGEYQIITGHDEAAILRATLSAISKGVVIGHNLFDFDLRFLATRCRINRLPCPLKFADNPKTISASAVYGKQLEYRPAFARGVDFVDTFHAIGIFDKAAAKLTSYTLKNSVLELGLRSERRLELSADEIRTCWERGDTDQIAEYLKYDLEDTRLLANYLLPVVWQQQIVVPKLSFQALAVASPALKAQRIHEELELPAAESDPKMMISGGAITCPSPGLHRHLAKIDVASLYPSLMLRYGLCSHKDPEHKFLGVLAYMVQERLRLKKLAKRGDKAADQQQGALKILINGSYGFFGTEGYTFNDYECAALVTAYGRKILGVMEATIIANGGVLVESDTDGVMFTAANASEIAAAVQRALPDGIDIELEFDNWCGWVPKAKNYVIFSPDGKAHVKGVYRKRDRCQLEREFPIEYLRRWFIDGADSAQNYYTTVHRALKQGLYPIEKLTFTRTIRANEVALRALGKPGEKVSFWYGYDAMRASTKVNTGDYAHAHYTGIIDAFVIEFGHEPMPKEQQQLGLSISF